MTEPTDEEIRELTRSVQALTDHVRELRESLPATVDETPCRGDVEAALARASRAARLRAQAEQTSPSAPLECSSSETVPFRSFRALFGFACQWIAGVATLTKVAM